MRASRKQPFEGADLYDGRRHIGSIAPCTRGFRALDPDDKRLGDFETEREAAAAITRADAERRAQAGGRET